jgi:uncharacterized protein YjbI with pentapeptide repeats
LYFADLTDVDFSDTCFDGTVLANAQFTGATLEKVKFLEVNLSAAQFRDADLREAQFVDAHLVGAQFRDAGLQEAQFPKADLREARFPNANLLRAQFPRANLSGAQFPNANLYDAQFPKADIWSTQFSDARLLGAKFPDAKVVGAKFPNADLREVQFSGADLTQAELKGADAQDADFETTVLHGADLTNTDLRGAKLLNAQLDQTVFSDTRIDATTDFGDSQDEWGPTCAYQSHPEVTDPPGDRDPMKAAEWVYRRLQKLHDENALSEEARGFHVRKEEARRKYHKKRWKEAIDSEGRWKWGRRYLVSWLNWKLTRHGESLYRILCVAFWVIILSAMLFPLGGFSSSESGVVYQYSLSTWLQVETKSQIGSALFQTIGTFLEGLYFSVITFTTIGYGDLYPTGVGSKILVGVESLAGTVLVALFIFVLGRRVAR